MTFDARAALLAKRAETIQRLKGLDESFADIVESVRDSNLDDEHDPEGSTVAVSRAQVASLAQEGREQLREIEAALRRLDDGAYGTCARCGGPIGDARLEARPTATLCIGCAQQENASPRR
ncbi:DNA-binding protein [Dermacoccus sp. PE3]|uniref:TraR/DksA family transcriptional regulator n=1 Tax=Dermacoccus sp. PE3 TaxID=1641401 RepID=UPI0006425167|nr:TraR/DksA family transcriptional regulator [Dermacoccus sp. PE3]KLO62416.1 DNA-binding protein [Dermacoccus sp. PE3]